MSSPIEPSKELPQEDRLPDLFKELMTEARWRRDQEAKLLTLFVSVFTVLAGGALVVLSKPEAKEYYFIVFIFVALSILLVGGLVAWKVRSENRIYSAIGGEVVWLWKHWRFIEKEPKQSSHPLPQSAANFGAGKGWLPSLLFVLILGILLILFSLLVIASSSKQEGAGAPTIESKTATRSCIYIKLTKDELKDFQWSSFEGKCIHLEMKK